MYMFTFDRHTCIIDACVCIQIRACMDAIGTGDRPTDRNRDRVSAGERERERKKEKRGTDTLRVPLNQRMKNVCERERKRKSERYTESADQAEDEKCRDMRNQITCEHTHTYVVIFQTNTRLYVSHISLCIHIPTYTGKS